ncbi:uncharacterized protein [Littorina saxatilis]|uniref:uncharacterized protein n=1 Tax=Littorina saxatilis TaxID=31220 RepID=UPI0038B468E5
MAPDRPAMKDLTGTVGLVRVTRGVVVTTRLISALLEAYAGPQGRDTLGVPLLDSSRMEGIWEEQKKHVPCLQDSPGISLYSETGTMIKGGRLLVTYRCARGSTSLESFHLHLNRFIPGDSAGAVNYQAYLLEGLARWNQDRAAAALPPTKEPWCYTGLITKGVNQLTDKVLGRKIIPNFKSPLQYTGELIGVDYLLQQSDEQYAKQYAEAAEELTNVDVEAKAADEDEGFNEEEIVEDDGTVVSVEDIFSDLPAGRTELVDYRTGYLVMQENRPSRQLSVEDDKATCVPSTSASTAQEPGVSCNLPQVTSKFGLLV